MKRNLSPASNTARAPNVTWHQGHVTRTDRERASGHRSVNVWFTGLSASGKSTIAHSVEQQLFCMGHRAFVFDGDNIRHGLCSDLGFTPSDRTENIRRIGEVVKLFLDAGIIALAAFISPIKKDREHLRARLGGEYFIEVYCKCPLEVCEERETKGLYRRARAGLINEFTGISAAYEEPEKPDLILETSRLPPNECVNAVVGLLLERGIIPEPAGSKRRPSGQ